MGIRLNYRPQAWRKSDQKVFVADITKAKKAFDWAPAVRKADGIRKMLDWMKNHGSQN